MLEFNIEPLSGQLVAHSEKCRFTTYWIEDGAWKYLTISTLTSLGPENQHHGQFLSLEYARQAAEEFESRIGKRDDNE